MMKKITVLLSVLLCVNIVLSTINIHYQLMAKKYSFALKEEHPKITVDVTMYNAVEAQCDADPLITAGMYKINPNRASEHKWIAMSRNLLKRWEGDFDYGDKVLIQGTKHKDGIYTVTDTMNSRFENKIDILETSGTPIYKFEDVTIQKINS